MTATPTMSMSRAYLSVRWMKPVGALERGIDAVEAAIEEIAPFRRHRRPQPEGALGRLEGHRVDRADEGSGGDDQGELTVHLSGQARQESSRQKDRHQYERDAHHRPEKLVHRLLGRDPAGNAA